MAEQNIIEFFSHLIIIIIECVFFFFFFFLLLVVTNWLEQDLRKVDATQLIGHFIQ